MMLIQGDCIEVMAAMPEASVDAIVTDPPYGLGFMGREWDALPPGREWAEQCLRVLRPGGHLLAFGGTRTYHRLAAAIEDAGFEIRDMVAWMYGSGFPKSLDVSKAIDKAAGAEREVIAEGAPVKRMIPGADQNRTGSWIKDNGREFVPTETAPATAEATRWEGWGTALKPAHEPIVVARKLLAGTVAGNVLAHGTGALNIGGCRVGAGSTRRQNTAEMGYHGGNLAAEYSTGSDAGRWPANVVLDQEAAAMLDEQSGTLRSGANPTRRGSDKFRDVYGDFAGQEHCEPARGADAGGASRFFYVAKPDAAERHGGLGTGAGLFAPVDAPERNNHPTVKPIDLLRWLCRLVTPPGGLVLDPFMGSGTTGCAAALEGFRFVGIEREPQYIDIARARLAHWALGQEAHT